jgi:hypothetical protein
MQAAAAEAIGLPGSGIFVTEVTPRRPSDTPDRVVSFLS